jgi:hypothetical protein
MRRPTQEQRNKEKDEHEVREEPPFVEIRVVGSYRKACRH